MPKKIIALLINPIENKKRNKLADNLRKILSDKDISFKSFIAEWPENINIYKQVWVIGGDGTLNYFINLYKDIHIPIALFKGGTGNDFAWNLYGNIELQNQIEHILNVQPKEVDAATCNDKIFINGVGIGFDGEVLRSINTIRFLGGHLGYLWVVIKKIFSFKENLYKIEIDGEVHSQKYLLVMITNSKRTGGGFLVSPEAEINDGKLNMILCNALPVANRLKYLPVIEKGKHLGKGFIQHRKVETIKISCKQYTFAQIDGELFSGEIFDITILPKKYLFLY